MRPPGDESRATPARRVPGASTTPPARARLPPPHLHRRINERRMRLTGKVVLITNVGQYMGPACAEEFAKEGAVLALHERTEARAQPALEMARAHGREACGGDGRPHRRRRGEPRGAHGRGAPRTAGRPGQQLEPGAPVGGPVDEVYDNLAVDGRPPLRRGLFCLRAAIRVMKRQGHGKVVNITSAVAIPGLPNYTAYSAAQGGHERAHAGGGPRGHAPTTSRSTRSPRTSWRTRPTSARMSPAIRIASPRWFATCRPVGSRGRATRGRSSACSWPRTRRTSSAVR